MKKKRVLFIIGTLQSGGVSKSIVNLLNTWDCGRYNTSLLVCSRKEDVFSEYLPSDMQILWNQDIESIYSGLEGIRELVSRGKLFLALGSLIRISLSFISKSYAAEMMSWLMPTITHNEFDLIVDYGGQQQLYYMINKLRGHKKVTFFHSDYTKWSHYYKSDVKYYPKVDKIFTISDICVVSLKSFFPNCGIKIQKMENINSSKIIEALSQKTLDINIRQKIESIHEKGGMVFITVGHVLYNKGIDFAIEAAKILVKKKYYFLWIFIGKVQESKWIDEIVKCHLNDYFSFMGVQANPYPYLRKADIFIHPSRFEGKSIALDEAKILCKPIIVTNFSTVNDQFKNRFNATICKMNGESLADSIEELINNKELRLRYIQNLRDNMMDNTNEVIKLYNILEGS